jgi:hypothetical protein
LVGRNLEIRLVDLRCGSLRQRYALCRVWWRVYFIILRAHCSILAVFVIVT